MWVKVLELDELAEGEVQSVFCSGHALCITHHGGRYGALEDVCPHRGAPLSAGMLRNGLVVCAQHAWEFDPFTGYLWGRQPCGVVTYATEVRHDGVYVALEPR